MQSPGTTPQTEPTLHLGPEDLAAALALAGLVRDVPTEAVLRSLLPHAPEQTIAAVSARARLDHAALVVLDDRSPEAVRPADHGLVPRPAVPSVVVRDRLVERFGAAGEAIEVQIVHVSLRTGRDGEAAASTRPTLELFTVADTSAAARAAVEGERADRSESHFAFLAPAVDSADLERIRGLLTGPAGMGADGGGYNPAHPGGGCTVLYFRGQGSLGPWPRRLEILTTGERQEVLRRHLSASARADTQRSAAPSASDRNA